MYCFTQCSPAWDPFEIELLTPCLIFFVRKIAFYPSLNKGLCVGPSLGLRLRDEKSREIRIWLKSDLGQTWFFFLTSLTWLSDSKSIEMRKVGLGASTSPWHDSTVPWLCMVILLAICQRMARQDGHACQSAKSPQVWSGSKPVDMRDTHTRARPLMLIGALLGIVRLRQWITCLLTSGLLTRFSWCKIRVKYSGEQSSPKRQNPDTVVWPGMVVQRKNRTSASRSG